MRSNAFEPGPTWFERKRAGYQPDAEQDLPADGLTWFERRREQSSPLLLPASPAEGQLTVRQTRPWQREQQAADRVTYEKHGAVAVVTRTWADNALAAIIAEQATALALLDDDIRVVVITGAGRIGGVLPQLDGLEDVARTRDRRLAAAPLLSDKLTIAALDGRVGGAGLADALACDLRVMGESASLLPTWSKDGRPVDPGIHLSLPLIVGASKATEILALGDPIPARKALTLGLTNWVTPDFQLRSYALDLARRLALQWSPEIAITKLRMREVLTPHLENQVEHGFD